MWCQLLYLIPGAILYSKFIYSDVTSVKLPFSQSFSFFFFMEKVFQNGKYTVEICTHSPDLNSPPPIRTRTPSSWLHPSPYLRTYFMDGPFAAKQLNIQCYNNTFGYNQKLSWKYCKYYHPPYIKGIKSMAG